VKVRVGPEKEPITLEMGRLIRKRLSSEGTTRQVLIHR
jgi:hypothetical protein